MSRSYKKTPVSGWYDGYSNKKFQTYEHGRERSAVRDCLQTEQYEDIPDTKTFGNEWVSPRDGKMYFGNQKNSPHGDCEKFYSFCRKCEYNRLIRK